MTGKFVIVADGYDVAEVVAWDDWLQRPISEREWDIFVVETTDALEAWLMARKQLREEGADNE